MRQRSVLGVAILLLATTYGNPESGREKKSPLDDTPPGSAGHHGSVQSGSGSGQFLLTNNENYGLQISHSPYSSNSGDETERVKPKTQKFRQRGPTHRSADPATPAPTDTEYTYCAGCLPLSPTGQGQDQDQQEKEQKPQPKAKNEYRPIAQPPSTYGVPVRQQLRRQQNQYQQQSEDVPQPQSQSQVTFSTGHNSAVGGMQQQQPDYTYSVKLQENPGQDWQPSSDTNSRGWSNNGNWNQQPKVQISPPQRQQYQWGQKIVEPVPQRQPASRSRARGQQQNINRDPGAVQHLQINDDGGYRFGYNSADSSRQEQRGMDGIVSGSYAYTDPTGQEVQVDYRASPNEGYQAFGPSIPLSSPMSNPVPVSQYQRPIQGPVQGPIQDTPEVQAARAQFFETYNQQLKFIEQAHADAKARETWAVPFGTQTEGQGQGSTGNEDDTDTDSDSSTDTGNRDVVSVDSADKKKNESKTEEEDSTTKPKKPLDFKNLPDPIPVPDPSTANHGAETEEDDELENDAVTVNRDDEEPSSVPAAVKVPRKKVKGQSQTEKPMTSNQDGPQASYSYSVMVGPGQGQGQGQQGQWPYWGSGNQGQNQYQQPSQSQAQPYTVGYQYQQPIQPIGQYQPQQNSNNGWSAMSMPTPVQASYNFNQMVGVGVAAPPQAWNYQQQPQVDKPWESQQIVSSKKQNQEQKQNQGEMMSDNMKPTSPAYFYYVSVGGNPQDYVTSSNLFNTGYPTSLKAHMIGAIPQDGRHDAQVPHPQNMGKVQNEVGTRANPPVYLDMDPSKMSPKNIGANSNSNTNQQNQPLAIVGFIPGALVSLRNGGYVTVNSAAVAQSGNGNGAAVGGGTSIRIQNRDSPNGNGYQFPLLVFRDRD